MLLSPQRCSRAGQGQHKPEPAQGSRTASTNKCCGSINQEQPPGSSPASPRTGQQGWGQGQQGRTAQETLKLLLENTSCSWIYPLCCCMGLLISHGMIPEKSSLDLHQNTVSENYKHLEIRGSQSLGLVFQKFLSPINSNLCSFCKFHHQPVSSPHCDSTGDSLWEQPVQGSMKSPGVTFPAPSLTWQYTDKPALKT